MKIIKYVQPVLEDDSRRNWYVFYFITIISIGVGFFRPTLIGNEMVYLIDGKRMVDPNFLIADWTLGGPVTFGMNFFYSSLVSLLWRVSSDIIFIALVSRILLWCAFVFAVFRMAKILCIPPFFVFFGTVLFTYGGQSVAASEWIIGGGEQKVLAYTFLLLALNASFQDRFMTAGIFSGLALNSHILVGGYGAFALSILVFYLFITKGKQYHILFRYVLPLGILTLPILVTALNYLGTEATTITIPDVNINESLVLLRNPHHLNPAYFFNVSKVILLVFAVSTLGYVLSKGNKHYKKLLVFLLPLLGLFLAGIVARFWELYFFLNVYPFRVADTLIPFFMVLLVPYYFYQVKFRFIPPFKQGVFIFLTVMIWGYMPLFSLDKVVTRGTTNYKEWSQLFTENQSSPQDKLVRWIKANSEETDIFLVNPFWLNFWLDAEQPMVVSFKSCPVNQKFYGWYKRMQALNKNKDFEQSGFKIKKQVTENFQNLSIDELVQIREDYNAVYYVIPKERTDLVESLVYKNEEFHLYNIEMLGSSRNESESQI